MGKISLIMNRSLLILAVLAVFCATAYAADCKFDATKALSDNCQAVTDKTKYCACLKDMGFVKGCTCKAADAACPAFKTAADKMDCNPASVVLPSVIISALAMFAHLFR